MPQFRGLVFILTLALILIPLGSCSQGMAEDVFADSLNSKVLASVWKKGVSKEAAVSAFAVGEQGVTLTVSSEDFVLLKKKNEFVGSDDQPLVLSAQLWSDPKSPAWSGLHLYWDPKNHVSLNFNGKNDLQVVWQNNGRSGHRSHVGLAPNGHRAGVYLKMVLLTRNIFFYLSNDGVHWSHFSDLGARPGPAQQPPSWMMLGRGWSGPQPELANKAPQATGKAKPVASRVRDVHIQHGFEKIPKPDPDFVDGGSWQGTIEKMEHESFPKKWMLLGPRAYQHFLNKDGLAPEKTDEWFPTPKDERGQDFRITEWEGTGEEAKCYVDLEELLDPDRDVVAYARTKIERSGPSGALLWFDSDGQSVVYLNNKKILDLRKHKAKAVRDRICRKVTLHKGVNFLKVTNAQKDGHWGFYVRLESDEPAFRIRFLSELLNRFPAEAATHLGGEARLEIARQYERIHDFSSAARAYAEALEAHRDSAEYHMRAWCGRLRILERLRDWNALAAAGAEYLKAFPNRAGSQRALEAFVLGTVRADPKALDRAEEKTRAWLKQAGGNPSRLDRAWRMLAGVAALTGQHGRQQRYLEILGEQEGVPALERARGWFEAADSRAYREYLRAVKEGAAFKPNLQQFKAACANMEKGIALLAGRSNPNALAFSKEAAADLKAGKVERALAGFRGAALIAMCASEWGAGPDLVPTDLHKEPAIKKGNFNQTVSRYREALTKDSKISKGAALVLSTAWSMRPFSGSALYPQAPGQIIGSLQGYRSQPKVVAGFGHAGLCLFPSSPDLRSKLAGQIYYWLRNVGRRDKIISLFAGYRDKLETWVSDPQKGVQVWAWAEWMYDAMPFAGEAGGADGFLRDSMACYPEFTRNVGRALIYRATTRHDFMLTSEAVPFYERAVREYSDISEVGVYGTKGLAYVRAYFPERLLFDLHAETQMQVVAADRMLASGGDENIRQAAANLARVMRVGANRLYPIQVKSSRPRVAGLRAYVRSMLLDNKDGRLRAYQDKVSPLANMKFDSLASLGSPEALADFAGGLPFTVAGALGLNRAGNLFLDQGDYGSGALVFQMLLRDYRGLLKAGKIERDGTVLSEQVVLAKLARALWRNGEWGKAQAFAQELCEIKPDKTIHVAGSPVKATAFGKTILQAIAQAEKSQGFSTHAGTVTFGGSVQRNGPVPNSPKPEPGAVAWVRKGLPSSTQDRTKEHMTKSYLQSYPVMDGKRAFVSVLEGIQSIDVKSGRVLWSHAWNSYGAMRGATFSGSPISCPTLHNGALYLRTLENQSSALRCYDADDGRLLWSSEATPSLRRVVWLSDPLVAYGLAMAVFLEPGHINLHGIAALDLHTGRLKWKRTLVLGFTGIRIGRGLYASSMQLGPPATKDGIVYTQTGMASVAAVEALTGEVIWISGYQRITIKNNEHGNSRIIPYIQAKRTERTMSRGPVSPMVTPDAVIVAPKDAQGLMAFRRDNGKHLWHRDLLDVRFLCGLSGDLVLTGDQRVRALHVASGEEVWSYQPRAFQLFGRPGFSGGVLYLPYRDGLHRVEQQSGQLLDVTPWPKETGPLANLVISENVLLGVNKNWSAALLPKGAAVAQVPELMAAQSAARKAQWEKAATGFARELSKSSPTSEDFLPALCGEVRALWKLGKSKEALQAAANALAKAPARLRSEGSSWAIQKEVLHEALQFRLGGKPESVQPVEKGVQGELALAWKIDGASPHLYLPKLGPQDRFFARVGNYLYLLRTSRNLEELWRTYAGPKASVRAESPTVLVLTTALMLRVIDRATGERLWERRGRFQRVAVDNHHLAVYEGVYLRCFELDTGKLLWTKRDDNRYHGPVTVALQNGKVIEIYSRGRSGDSIVIEHEPQSGKELRKEVLKTYLYGPALTLAGTNGAMMRSKTGQIHCLNLATGKSVWTSPKLTPVSRIGDPGWLGFFIAPQTHARGPLLGYTGGAGGRGHGTPTSYYLHPKDGRLHAKVEGAWSQPVADSFVKFTGASIERWDPEKGKLKKAWDWKGLGHDRQHVPKAMLSLQRDTLYVLYVRAGHYQGAHVFRLVMLDWESGNLQREVYLPGSPIKVSGTHGEPFVGPVLSHGGLLMYGGNSALYAFGSTASSVSEVAAKLQKELEDPATPLNVRRLQHRALSGLTPLKADALLTPRNIQVDGNLREWEGMEPIQLRGWRTYQPLKKNAKLRNEADLGARVFTGWSSKGFYMGVDVQDDVLVRSDGSLEGKGDRIRVAINAHSDSRSAFDRKNLVFSVAWSSDNKALTVESDVRDELRKNGIQVRVALSPKGNGLSYELLIPWPLLRSNAKERPGARKELAMGIAIYDDDGAGVSGALEWGAAVTNSKVEPVWMGKVSLLEISREMIESYRKAIDKVADQKEVWTFMARILSSQRGANALAGKSRELERFVRTHPQSRNTPRVLALLQKYQRDRGLDDAQARLASLVKEAKCSPVILKDLESSLNVWVCPDPKKPAQMIVLTFLDEASKQWRRVYWGRNFTNWAREGPSAMVYMGAIPKPGKWTRLTVTPLMLGLEASQIMSAGYACFYGTAYFDRASFTINGKETVYLDDALPSGMDSMKGNGYGAFGFVKDPRKQGGASWKIAAGGRIQMSALTAKNGKPLFGFKSSTPIPKAVKLPLEKKRAVDWDVANILEGAPEGHAFLKAVLESHTGSDGTAKKIAACEQYLKAHPESRNALAILFDLMGLYQSAGVKNPLARCESTMKESKLSENVWQGFYSRYAPIWLDWHVIGPFAGPGVLRGLNIREEPERQGTVDLTWTTTGLGDHELAWKKVDGVIKRKGKKDERNTDLVNLHHYVMTGFPKEHRKELEGEGFFAYAYRSFEMPFSKKVTLLFGVRDLVSIWVNGKKIVSEAAPGNEKDSGSASVTLRKGENNILIKAGGGGNGLYFRFRFADGYGRPIPQLPRH